MWVWIFIIQVDVEQSCFVDTSVQNLHSRDMTLADPRIGPVVSALVVNVGPSYQTSCVSTGH